MTFGIVVLNIHHHIYTMSRYTRSDLILYYEHISYIHIFWFETVRNEIVLERTLTVSIYRHENKNIFSGSFCFGMYDVSNSSFKGWKVKFWWLLIICCKLTWIIMMNFQWVSKAICFNSFNFAINSVYNSLHILFSDGS